MLYSMHLDDIYPMGLIDEMPDIMRLEKSRR